MRFGHGGCFLSGCPCVQDRPLPRPATVHECTGCQSGCRGLEDWSSKPLKTLEKLLRKCLHLWRGPRSSKPRGGLTKAPSGFDSHTLPLSGLRQKTQAFIISAITSIHSSGANPPSPAGQFLV